MQSKVRSTVRWLLFALGLLIAIFILFSNCEKWGCGPIFGQSKVGKVPAKPPSPEGKVALPETSTDESQLRPVRLAYQDRVVDAAVIIAVEKGLLTKRGVRYQAARFSSGPACAEALTTGASDLGTMGDTTSLIASSKTDIELLASHGGGENRHRLVVRGDSPYHSLKDLLGQRIAVKKGTSTYGGLLLLFKQEGYTPDQFDLVNMKPSMMGEALQSGSLDAAVASEPTPTLLESKGARQICTLGGLGSTYPVLLVCRKRFLEEQPETVTKVLQAIKEGEDFIKAHPDEAADLVSKATGLSPELAKKSMSYHYYDLVMNDELLDGLNRLASFLESEGRLSATYDVREHVAKGLLEQALQQ